MIWDPIEVEALLRSDWVTNDPDDNDAEVRVLPPKLQISEADGTDPKLISEIARSRFEET